LRPPLRVRDGNTPPPTGYFSGYSEGVKEVICSGNSGAIESGVLVATASSGALLGDFVSKVRKVQSSALRFSTVDFREITGQHF